MYRDTFLRVTFADARSFVYESVVQHAWMMTNQICLKNETKSNALLISHSGLIKILCGVLSKSGQNEWSDAELPGHARLHRKTYPNISMKMKHGFT
jgi:hypothetical protein